MNVKTSDGWTWCEWLKWRDHVASGIRFEDCKVQADPAKHSFDTLVEFVSALVEHKQAVVKHRLDRALIAERGLEDLKRELGVSSGVRRRGRVARMGSRLAMFLQHTRRNDRYETCHGGLGWPPRGDLKLSWAAPSWPAGDGDEIAPESLFVAIDCEMVETPDDQNALARFVASDAEGNILLDRLVKPPQTPTDCRTKITGITEADLEAVSYTRADAQRDLVALLTQRRAVLVGHALQHDMRALRIDWPLILDTGLLFGLDGWPSRAPGLAHLVAKVLGEKNFRGVDGKDVHSCPEDARASMRLALHRLRGADDRPISLVPPPDNNGRPLLPLQAKPQPSLKLEGKPMPSVLDEDMSIEINMAVPTAGGGDQSDSLPGGARWKRVLDSELEAAGGALPWKRLRTRLVAHCLQAGWSPSTHDCMGDEAEDLGRRVLAGIPIAYLSKEDALVRLPPSRT